jgi:hypothetical protein
VRNPSHYQLRDFHKALNADIVKKAEKAGGSPAWLKDYAGQLEDPEYASLTLDERGLLKDLRLLALRRGNKIPNDEAYLRAQLRCNSRTRLVQRLLTLCAKGFLEVHTDAYELPANVGKHSRTRLEPGESQVTLDKNPFGDKKESSSTRAVVVDADERHSFATFLKEAS